MPTAIFTYNSTFLSPIREVLKRKGLRVGEDISVVVTHSGTADDSEVMNLAATCFDHELIGSCAIDCLEQRVTDRESASMKYRVPFVMKPGDTAKRLKDKGNAPIIMTETQENELYKINPEVVFATSSPPGGIKRFPS